MCSRQSIYQFVSNVDVAYVIYEWNIRDVQETIFVLVLFVDAAHERGSGWQDLIDEDEDGLLGAKLDALANDIDELSNGQICGDEVLLLVDGSDVGFFHLFADDL